MKDLNLFKAKDSLYLKEISNKTQISSTDYDGFLIKSSESEVRKIIASLKDKKYKGKIALQGSNDSFNRRAIETLKIDYLVSPEALTNKDSPKQRDSGLNHVIAKTAKEKDIKIVINMGEIATLDKKTKTKRIAKLIQNAAVCRKAGCKILIASFASSKKNVIDPKGRQSFGVGLGMSSKQVKECIEFV